MMKKKRYKTYNRLGKRQNAEKKTRRWKKRQNGYDDDDSDVVIYDYDR